MARSFLELYYLGTLARIFPDRGTYFPQSQNRFADSQNLQMVLYHAGRFGWLGLFPGSRTTLYQRDSMPNDLVNLLDQEKIINPCYFYANSSVQDGSKILMFGDSMFGSWNATNFLAENFSEFTYIWDNQIRESIIDYINPDVLIYEVTERFLNQVPGLSFKFLSSPLDEYSSEVVSQRFENSDLFVTVKNTSSAVWKPEYQVKCGLSVDGKDTGLRATIPYGTQVPPGESFEFRFADVKPHLSYGSEIMMLQESIAYFPERTPVELPN